MKTAADLECLYRDASELRALLVEVSSRTRTAHLGSCLSCVDILVSLFRGGILRFRPDQPDWTDRDRFIMSKGHAANALYAVLSFCGFFPRDVLWTIGVEGSQLEEHPCRELVPGVEVSTGSLGHGLPIGCGLALSAKIKGKEYQTCVLMSDGECNEGSVWEAAMFACANGLDSLTVVVDYNKWQATGRSNEVLALADLKQKWSAFGWKAVEVDGHDIDSLCEALAAAKGRGPAALVAHTVKGKGISFMEDDNNWHYRIPSLEEVIMAYQELGIDR